VPSLIVYPIDTYLSAGSISLDILHVRRAQHPEENLAWAVNCDGCFKHFAWLYVSRPISQLTDFKIELNI
jgi:hypothetical protein